MTLTQLPPVVGSFFKKNRILLGIVEAIIFPYNEDTEKGEIMYNNLRKLKRAKRRHSLQALVE